MSDNYHYEDGAIHNDHKRVLHIGSVGRGDVGKLISAFFKDDAEEAEYEEAGAAEEGEALATEPASEPTLNYFAPKKNLQELLKQPWFKAVRTKVEYDGQWTDAFAEALMESEYRDDIARDWAVQCKRNKRTQIKGYIVGLLADADVLKGSYDSIAKEVGLTDDPRSFSRYMGQGKRQAYADWVQEYVAKNTIVVK